MIRSRNILPASCAVLLALLACNLNAPAAPGPQGTATAGSKPIVKITSPADGADVSEGDSDLEITSVSADPRGILYVDLIVDGQVAHTDPVPDAKQNIVLTQTWKAVLGMHTISVQAYNLDNVPSDPATISVTVTRSFTDSSGVAPFGLPGLYSNAGPCKAQGECATSDHSLKPVDVGSGSAAQVEISDWFAPFDSAPLIFDFSNATSVPTPNGSSLNGTINGTVLYPAPQSPSMLVMALPVNTYPFQYFYTGVSQGDTYFTMEVPAGRYYVIAYTFPGYIETPIPSLPAAPVNLTETHTCTSVSASGTTGYAVSAQLNWTDAAGDETAYILEYGPVSEQLPVDSNSAAISNAPVPAGGLAVRVIAQNNVGESASNTLTISCP